MGLLDYIMDRNKEKQEEAQTQEQASANKAKDDQTAIDRTQTEIASEAEKQREAEERGDSASAGRAKERIDELNRQSGTLKAEKATLESVEKAAHEMVSVYQSQPQATSQVLDLATAYVVAEVAEKAPLPGSVSEYKEQMRAQQRKESDAAPSAVAIVNALPAQVQSDIEEVASRLEKASQHISGLPSSTDAPTDGGDGGNAALRQLESNQDKAQAALSPTDEFKGKTRNERKAPATNSPSEKEEKKPSVDTQQIPARSGRTWER